MREYIEHDLILKNKIEKRLYQIKIYNMGLVDKNNKVNFYDGKIRVKDPEDKEY